MAETKSMGPAEIKAGLEFIWKRPLSTKQRHIATLNLAGGRLSRRLLYHDDLLIVGGSHQHLGYGLAEGGVFDGKSSFVSS